MSNLSYIINLTSTKEESYKLNRCYIKLSLVNILEMVFVFIEILFEILLFKGGVLIYAEHCMLWYDNIWKRYNYLKIWNPRVVSIVMLMTLNYISQQDQMKLLNYLS